MVVSKRRSNFISYSKTHEGKVRALNEDALFCNDEKAVWVVADGMGGHEAGDYASQLLVTLIEQRLNIVDSQDLTVTVLKTIILEANETIKEYSVNQLNDELVGTTVAMLFIESGRYHCLWVGDSRIYLYRDKQLTQKTRDHSQVMDMVEQGLISIENAEVHPKANIITRAVGVGYELDIDEVSDIICDGDKFILCTDGLTKELNYVQMSDCLRAEKVKDSVLVLMHSALVKQASDNITCVMVQVFEDNESNDLDITIPIF